MVSARKQIVEGIDSERGGRGPAGKDASSTGGLVPSPVRFAVIKKQLEDHGWRLIRVSASHHVFKKPNAPDVVIPVHGGKVKPFYVRQVAKLTAKD